MARPLGARQIQALQAVAEGRVEHVHPFSWAIPGDFYDVAPYSRWFHLFNGLVQRKLIRVEAGSREHQRPVHLTDAGRDALAQQRAASRGAAPPSEAH